MFELNFIVVSLLFAPYGGSSYSLITSCTRRNVEPWNTHMMAANIEMWLRSGVTVAGEGKVQSRLFQKHTGVFTQHFAYYNDERVDDTVNEFKPIEEFKNKNVDPKYGNDDDNTSYYDAEYKNDYDNKYKNIDANENDDGNNDNDENNNDDYDNFDDDNDNNDNVDNDDGNIDDNNEYNNENDDDDNKNDNSDEQEEDTIIQRVGNLIKFLKNNLFKQYLEHHEHTNIDAGEQEEDANILKIVNLIKDFKKTFFTKYIKDQENYDQNYDNDDKDMSYYEEDINIKYGLVDDCDYPYFNENDRSVVTIRQFPDGIPSGIVWQWKSRRFEDGFLYGQVNREGRFTGDNITFIYPDLKTGIRGTFINGKMVAGLEVKITGERCNGGIKELRIKTVEKRKGIVWKRENLNATYIGKYPTVRDPLDHRNTYIGQSTIPASGEGVFAKRDFLPGQLVTYLSGMKLQEEDIFSSEMTRAEKLVAGAYCYAFGRTYLGFPKYLYIDQPPGYRQVKDYRTTLGHKVNHNFIGANTKWRFVRHPSHGPVVSVIAIEPIAKGQELLVNYKYDLNVAPQWYVDLAREQGFLL